VGVVAKRENALQGRANFEPQRDSASALPLLRWSGVQGSTWAVEKSLGPRPHTGYQGFKFDADMADAENQKDLPDLRRHDAPSLE
jgi:hypothetical protein